MTRLLNGGYYFPGGATVNGLREKRWEESKNINAGNKYYDGTDNFDSTTQKITWTTTMEDATHWSLTGTEMQITTQAGTLNGATNTTKNIKLKDRPVGDYMMTTKLTFSPTQNGQEAGLIVYLSDLNYSVSSIKHYTEVWKRYLKSQLPSESEKRKLTVFPTYDTKYIK